MHDGLSDRRLHVGPITIFAAPDFPVRRKSPVQLRLRRQVTQTYLVTENRARKGRNLNLRAEFKANRIIYGL